MIKSPEEERIERWHGKVGAVLGAIVVLAGLVYVFASWGSTPAPAAEPPAPAVTAPQDTSAAGSVPSSPSSAGSPRITVRVEAQDLYNSRGQQKVVVWITNNGSTTWDGNVGVFSKDVDGRTLGWDVVYVEDLAPGTRTWAILWLKTAPFAPMFEYEVR